MVRDFPLESIHPHAFKAAEAAQCAREQGKFWEMHERLFTNQAALAPDDLSRHAQAVGLDIAKFEQCLQSSRHASRVRQDFSDGEQAGVRGTPTFFLGLAEPDGARVRVVRVIRGAQSFAAFKAAIDSALAAGN